MDNGESMQEYKLTVVDIARQKLESMDSGDVGKLITQGKSGWTRGQNVTMRVDRFAGNEKDLFQGDDELIELLVLKQVIEQKITERMNTILSKSRGLPYQISDRGIRIHMSAYDMEKLKKGLNKAGLDFEPDYYNEVAYIKPISKYKGVEGSLPEIKPILECAVLNDEGV